MSFVCKLWPKRVHQINPRSADTVCPAGLRGGFDRNRTFDETFVSDCIDDQVPILPKVTNIGLQIFLVKNICNFTYL
jgi:hypothetical protein